MIGVIVVAAGSGTRLGRSHPKALVEVGGRTLLERSLEAVFQIAEPCRIVVVAPPDHLSSTREVCVALAGPARDHLSFIAGGSSRQESVRAGLSILSDDVDIVLVHDCARAFTPLSQFASVIEAVRTTGGGVVPALPVSDTIKRTDSDGIVVETPNRSSLVAVQTPQGFPRGALVAAYDSAIAEHTDDAALFSAAGGSVSVVAGDALAFKVTTPWDLRRAEGIVSETSVGPSTTRTGVGVDVHAFDDSTPLWLGALHWPGEPGLAGHSDGDAVSHAVCDALLSASGLGDIGSRFGTSDPRYAGARGEVFLTATIELLAESGFAVGNVAVQIVAEHPKLSRRRSEVEERLSRLVGAPVSVSATTSDALGFTGRGEGLAVIATALVYERPRLSR